MEASILEALRCTLIADSNQIRNATNFLKTASKSPGYCTCLMSFVEQPTLPFEIKQAALAQLKNTIMFHWKHSKEPIQQAQKAVIKARLLQSVISATEQHPKLIKQYRETISFVYTFEMPKWPIEKDIMILISQGNVLETSLNCLIGVAVALELRNNQQERAQFKEFSKLSLVGLRGLLERNQEPPIVYLSVKFFWKLVHFEMEDEVKWSTLDWMPFLLRLVSLTHPEFDAQSKQPDVKGSSLFYYIHSKKWATRIAYKYMQFHAKKIENKRTGKEFVDEWHNKYGKQFFDAILHQLGVSNANKVRSFQLKTLKIFTADKPEYITPFVKQLQFEVLPHYFKTTKEDEETAMNSPVEFINSDVELFKDFQNVRGPAVGLWTMLAELGAKQGHNSYQPSPFFYPTIEWLQGLLNSENPLEREMALFLICKLKSPILLCSPVKSVVPELLGKYVVRELTSSTMFLRIRAIQVFDCYGKEQLPEQVLLKAISHLFECMAKDRFVIVQIKATLALNSVIHHQAAKNFVQPHLESILNIYVNLMRNYDLESLVNGLEDIVQDFSKVIAPYAVNLTNYLSGLFIQLSRDDPEKDSFEEETELMASGCLKTISKIFSAPLDQSIVVSLQPQVLKLFEHIFGNDSLLDYVEDCLSMFDCYLEKCTNINPTLWTIFPLVVYGITGLPQDHWNTLMASNQSPSFVGIMSQLRHNSQIQRLQVSYPILRKYLIVGLSEGETRVPAQVEISILQQIFFLFEYVMSECLDQYDFLGNMPYCISLMVAIVLAYQDTLPLQVHDKLLCYSLKFCTRNAAPTLHKLNSQLLAVLLWALPRHTLQFITAANSLPMLFKELVCEDLIGGTESERQRIILGITAVFKQPSRHPHILTAVPSLFKHVVKLIHKNAKCRLEQEDENSVEEEDADMGNKQGNDDQFSDFDDDDLQNLDKFEEDDVLNPLDSIDEIIEFQETLIALNGKDTEFYQQLMKLLGPEERNKLSAVIQEVKNQLASAST